MGTRVIMKMFTSGIIYQQMSTTHEVVHTLLKRRFAHQGLNSYQCKELMKSQVGETSFNKMLQTTYCLNIQLQ